MLKKIEFKFLNLEFNISMLNIALFSFIYLFGIIYSLFLNVNLDDTIYSPFIILYNGSSFSGEIFHYFLYFYLSAILGLFFSSSALGFIFIPFILFLKGIFTGISILYLIQTNFHFLIFFTYSLVFSVEIFIIILFFVQYFSNSFISFKRKITLDFDISLKYFFIEIIILTLLTFTISLSSYFNLIE